MGQNSRRKVSRYRFPSPLPHTRRIDRRKPVVREISFRASENGRLKRQMINIPDWARPIRRSHSSERRKDETAGERGNPDKEELSRSGEKKCISVPCTMFREKVIRKTGTG